MTFMYFYLDMYIYIFRDSKDKMEKEMRETDRGNKNVGRRKWSPRAAGGLGCLNLLLATYSSEKGLKYK